MRGKEIINKGKEEKDVYLVTFRLLKKDSNEIIYNYICYPDIFTNSLVGHLTIKSGFNSSFLFKEWGDFYAIIDNSLGVGDTMNEIKDKYLVSYDVEVSKDICEQHGLDYKEEFAKSLKTKHIKVFK